MMSFRMILSLLFLIGFSARAATPDPVSVLNQVLANSGDVLVQSVTSTQALLSREGYETSNQSVFLNPPNPGIGPGTKFDLMIYYYLKISGSGGNDCTSASWVVPLILHCTGEVTSQGQILHPTLNGIEVSRYYEPGACPPGTSSSGG
ncbi:MAG: hypothetical protein ACXWRE_10070 [Pseudobdellovibrionaceae bacterium]